MHAKCHWRGASLASALHAHWRLKASASGTRRGDILDFEDRHPTRDDVALVVEVSDSTQAGARLKRRVYARAGIPTDWIVNLVDSPWEVFTNPGDTGGAADYSSEAILTRTDVVTWSLPNHAPLEIAVADLVR